MQTQKDWKAFNIGDEIDKKLFDTTVTIFCFVAPVKYIKIIINKIGDFGFHKKGIRPVVENPSDTQTKLILLSETISETNMPQEQIDLKEKYSLQTTTIEKTFGYDQLAYLELLKKILPEDVTTPSGFETIGSISHLNLRGNQCDYKYIIGKVILEKTPNLTTVCNKTEKLDNVYRTPTLELLAGEHNYETVISEGKCKMTLDFQKVYWCSRLSSERERVQKVVKNNQVVCDAFCGIGPFALRCYKDRNCRVFASDLNPECYKYLCINRSKNKFKEDMFLCDNKCARVFIEETQDRILAKEISKIHHFYMNLPALAIDFTDVYPEYFRDKKLSQFKEFFEAGPQVHVYCFTTESDAENEIFRRIKDNMPMFSKDDIVTVHELKPVSANKDMMCATFKLNVRNCEIQEDKIDKIKSELTEHAKINSPGQKKFKLE